jgi:hypothetical protein
VKMLHDARRAAAGTQDINDRSDHERIPMRSGNRRSHHEIF